MKEGVRVVGDWGLEEGGYGELKENSQKDTIGIFGFCHLICINCPNQDSQNI